ncbi:MAG: hypothetical protein ABSB73_11160 [Solirubrobacteraceae bacterium]|jgi:hypothetical protein
MEARIDTPALTAGAPRLRLAPSPGATSAFGDTLLRARRTARRMRARRPAPPASYAPPAEVQRELAEAAIACQTLAAQGKELRFGRCPDGRVSVELIDGSGRPVDVIGPTGLFALLAQSH